MATVAKTPRGGMVARVHGGTAAQRNCGTAALRHGGTVALRHSGAAAKGYNGNNSKRKQRRSGASVAWACPSSAPYNPHLLRIFVNFFVNSVNNLFYF